MKYAMVVHFIFHPFQIPQDTKSFPTPSSSESFIYAQRDAGPGGLRQSFFMKTFFRFFSVFFFLFFGGGILGVLKIFFWLVLGGAF